MPVVVRLMSEFWPEPAYDDLVRRTWSAPAFDREHDARLEPDAYADVGSVAFGDERVRIDLRGRPSAAMIDWAEARAREKGSRLFAGAWTANEPLQRELERRGFRPVRHSQRMEIDLRDPVPPPIWPDGIAVRSFRAGDEHAFYETHQESFADSWEPIDEPFEEWAHWQLQPPAFVPGLWFLAIAGEEPAGVAICHPHAGAPEIGWVRILGVRRQWRNRGLGRALLLHAFSEFRRRGLTRAGLGVDAESVTGANRLYERVGMHVSARFDIYEKAVS